MEKQIEEMAKAIHVNCHKGLTKDEADMIAKWCYQEIDRKASEIFAEIDKAIHRYLPIIKDYQWQGNLINDLAELKKKYTKSEDTVSRYVQMKKDLDETFRQNIVLKTFESEDTK